MMNANTEMFKKSNGSHTFKGRGESILRDNNNITREYTGPKNFILNNYEQGWYNSTGSHDPNNTNYYTGYSYSAYYRSFFVFNVPSDLSNNIISAELIINTYNFVSADASKTYELNAVSTPISVLTEGGSGLTNIYTDLGDGTVYGNRNVINTDTYNIISIPLNSNFINALVTAKGTQIALGGEITSLINVVNDEDGIFGYSGDNPGSDVQLAINYAPSVSISDVNVIEGEANVASVTVQLSQAISTPVTVNYTTGNDTALGGSDYTPQSGTLTFNPL